MRALRTIYFLPYKYFLNKNIMSFQHSLYL